MEPGRLRWLCRRGSRELDLLLLGYLDCRYPEADPQEHRAFERLLGLPDDCLQRYLLGQELPADRALADLIRQIRASASRAGSTEV